MRDAATTWITKLIRIVREAVDCQDVEGGCFCRGKRPGLQPALVRSAQVELEEWQGMHHVFQLNARELASARTALDRAAAFVSRHWSA